MAIVITLSLLFPLGLLIAATPASEPTVPIAVSRRAWRLLAGSIVAGGLVLLVSGWAVPALVVGLATGWVGHGWQHRQRSSQAEQRTLEALASWIENVRDVLTAGEQPIGAITTTVAACPPVLRPSVRRLAVGLGRQDPELVFRRFADDIDDPLGDLVAAGLSIAVRRGARTVPVLSALAEHTRHEVERRRLVEAERAPTRREVQALTLIMGGLVMALLVFGRSPYLAAYDEPGGQIFMAAALAGYAALIVRVQRLAAFPRPSRFLTARAPVRSASAPVGVVR